MKAENINDQQSTRGGGTTKSTGDAKRLDAIVIGGGIGGMCSIYRLREMGLRIVGIEAGRDVGGVWFWNRYPGARVDLPSIDYSFSFPEIEQEWTWSEQFAGQEELLRYIDFVAKRLDLRKHYQFNTRVTSAVWNETAKLWTVSTDRGERYEAPYCVMATGPLSVPKDPDIPGVQRFKGQILHAARWPHDPVNFEGKRVGVIGTGSTGIQIVQEVGRQPCSLFVFQRTPSFSFPMRNVPMDADYSAEVKRHYPAIREAARNSPVGGTRPQSTRPFFTATPAQRRQLLEDAWNAGGLSIIGTFGDILTNPEANEQVAEFVRSKIGEVVADPETAEKLKPRGYPILARRPCLDSGYYETYNRPNVHLVDLLTDPIVEITEKGVRTESGEVELDMILLATGYDGLTGALTAFDVVGRGGVKVNDKWRDGACSYLGMMMEGFPNLFMVNGPNGPAAFANYFRLSENDVDWITGVIKHMQHNGIVKAEVKGEAERAWMKGVVELANRSLVSKAKTWYVGANVKGKAQGLTIYTGGFHKYREHCVSVMQDGYRTLAFEYATEVVPA